MIFFAAILGLIILGAVAYFVWGNYINKGTVTLAGPAPFTATVFEGSDFSCDSSPCTFELKAGNYNLILEKDGFKSYLQEITVLRGQENNFNISFSKVPQLTEIEDLPSFPASSIKYILIKDEQTNLYKLVEEADDQQRAVATFPKAIKNPTILGNNNAVLVAGKSTTLPETYLINTTLKEKTSITDSEIIGIKDGLFSQDGKHLAFTKIGSDKLYLLTNNQVTELDVFASVSTYSWSGSNNLVIITKQATVTTGSNVTLNETLNENNLTILSYDPAQNTYKKLHVIPDQPILPTKLLVSGNEKQIFLEFEQLLFELNL